MAGYESALRKVYEGALEVARFMGLPNETTDIFRIQRLLFGNRIICYGEGEALPKRREELVIAARKLEDEYAEKFEQLANEQRGQGART